MLFNKKYFGYSNKRRKFVKIMSTVFLILLCSQLNTILQFKTSRQIAGDSIFKIEKKRKKQFQDITDDLNTLFDLWNYTIFENYVQYIGNGKLLQNEYFELQIPNTPFYKSFHAPNPVKDLQENWI